LTPIIEGGDRESMSLGDPLKNLFRRPRLADQHVTLHGCARQKSRGTGDDGLRADHLARYVDAVAFKDCLCITGSSESWEPWQHPHPWHSRARGGAVHGIKGGHHRVTQSARKRGRVPAVSRDRGYFGFIRPPSTLRAARYRELHCLCGSRDRPSRVRWSCDP
jgi:hypothetical protein